MSNKNLIIKFADDLIKQKKKTRSVKYVLRIGFYTLITGSLLSIPLRFLLGISFEIPVILTLTVLILTYIYGFLGIENQIDILQETDSILASNEKLSAAFQFSNSNNPFSNLLLANAVAIIHEVKIKEIFKVKFSKRDSFLPLLIALFFFLWMSNFTFLQVSDENNAIGDLLIDTAEKISAVPNNDNDKDIEDIIDEYNKLGKKLQEQFMSEKSIKEKVEELSLKMEKKIDELSREGVKKDSKTLGKDENESEIHQLQRKTEISKELSEILNSLMKTFQNQSDYSMENTLSKKEGNKESDFNSGNDEVLSSQEESTESGQSYKSENMEKDKEEPSDSQVVEPENEEIKDDRESSSGSDSKEEDGNYPGTGDNKDSNKVEELQERKLSDSQFQDNSQNITEEEKQSGEFDEERIRADLKKGEEMKSFVRALPHIVSPTLHDKEIIHYYRNQLETAIETESIPEGYESVIRDYFLSIGVLDE